MVSLHQHEALAIFSALSQSRKHASDTEAVTAAKSRLQKSLFLDAESLFKDIFSSTRLLASELGKAEPRLQLRLPSLWVTNAGEELIRGCFIHLLRNSLDHGLETAEVRKSFGKASEGTVTISAAAASQNITVGFEDDGRGLNLRKLRELAAERQLLAAADLGDDAKVAQLIFKSEMSTAEKVTDISGRGVGMAAVLEYVRHAGGDIEICFTDDRTVPEGHRAFRLLITLPSKFFDLESALIAA